MKSIRKTSDQILTSVEKIWNYHHINHELKKSDLIITLCSLDDSIAEYTADLYILEINWNGNFLNFL